MSRLRLPFAIWFNQIQRGFLTHNLFSAGEYMTRNARLPLCEIIGLLLSLDALHNRLWVGKDAAATMGWRPFRARTSFGDRTGGCAALAPGYSLVPLPGFHCSFFEWPNSSDGLLSLQTDLRGAATPSWPSPRQARYGSCPALR